MDEDDFESFFFLDRWMQSFVVVHVGVDVALGIACLSSVVVLVVRVCVRIHVFRIEF